MTDILQRIQSGSKDVKQRFDKKMEHRRQKSIDKEKKYMEDLEIYALERSKMNSPYEDSWTSIITNNDNIKHMFKSDLMHNTHWTGIYWEDFLIFLKGMHPLMGIFGHKHYPINIYSRILIILSGVGVSHSTNIFHKCETICIDNCYFQNNGICEDGINPFNDTLNKCIFGYDCTDCGIRDFINYNDKFSVWDDDYCFEPFDHFMISIALSIFIGLYMFAIRELLGCFIAANKTPKTKALLKTIGRVLAMGIVGFPLMIFVYDTIDGTDPGPTIINVLQSYVMCLMGLLIGFHITYNIQMSSIGDYKYMDEYVFEKHRIKKINLSDVVKSLSLIGSKVSIGNLRMSSGDIDLSRDVSEDDVVELVYTSNRPTEP